DLVPHRSPDRTMTAAARPLLLLGLVALGLSACGKDDPPPPADTKQDEPPVPVVVPPAAGSTGDHQGTGGSTAADPFATDGWADDTDGAATVGMDAPDTDGSPDTDGEAAATPVYAGPCWVRWSGGPVLRFKYEADGS